MRKFILVARAGYLCEIHSRRGHECAGCPMSEICSVPAPGSVKMKMYMLTEKGRECVKAAKNEEAIKWESN